MNYSIIVFVSVLLPMGFIGKVLYDFIMEQKAIKRLCVILFPEGEAQKQEVIDGLCELTSNRFSKEDLLDYYLKIKGLQMLDLHTGGDANVRAFLMQPTKIHLTYRELVKFYEIYLNYPQVAGVPMK
ncbi:MAG: hypothetical protein IKR17_11545 [Bacteroidales bacterium]|nr:hypothetical protein [Bacteroidales bacterium]